MAAARQDHPTQGQLQEYALGKGDPDLRAFVEDHLAGCSSCAAVLLEAPADTLVGKLRDAGTVGLVGDTIGPAPDVPAELIDHPKYRILRQLGAGGMGVVYQAVHKLMEREVALKVISANLMRHPVAVERFRQEMKAVAKLSHPNIVAAHDAEQVGDLHFLVMEYVDGASLDRLVRKSGPMALSVACYMVRQALLGLQHAHEKGLVHRDLKPQNLMVTRKGQVKVLDFGLARLAEEAARPASGRPLTAVGTVVGTPDYIAPEQVSNSHTVDVRADIYSLGCTLYFLLTGRPPYPEGSPLEKALSHVQEVPAPLRSLRPEVPAELVEVVGRMMAKKPAGRYATPAEAAQALLPFTKSGAATTALPIVTGPASDPVAPTAPITAPSRTRTASPSAPSSPKEKRRPFWPWPWPLPWVIGIGAGVLLLGALIGLGFAWAGHRPPPPPQPEPAGQHESPPAGPPQAKGKPRVLLVVPRLEDQHGLQRALDGQAEVSVAFWQATKPRFPFSKGGVVQSGFRLKNARAEDFHAVIFSSSTKPEPGHEWWKSEDIERLIRATQSARKPVAGLGYGVCVLVKAGALRGKRTACPDGARTQLKNLGFEVADQCVVESDNAFTACGPDNAEELVKALMARIRR